MQAFIFKCEPLTVRIDFKGKHFPQSVILSAVFSKCATVSHIVTWKRSILNVALLSIMPRWTAG